MNQEEPWSPATATEKIRALAKHPRMAFSYKLHAKERMAERELISSDILYALKNGFVYRPAAAATRPDLYRYLIECKTPNSRNRVVGVVVIPAVNGCLLKIVTVMWIDEYGR